MASKIVNAQVEETPSEKFERVISRVMERQRRADARRAKRNRASKVAAS